MTLILGGTGLNVKVQQCNYHQTHEIVNQCELDPGRCRAQGRSFKCHGTAAQYAFFQLCLEVLEEGDGHSTMQNLEHAVSFFN